MSDDNVVSWSYSAMSTFETCPRQYHGKYITKEAPFVQNAAAKWGDDVHKALEEAIKVGRPLPSNMTQYQSFLDAVRNRASAIKGQLIAEQPVALSRDLKQMSWFTKKTAAVKVWFRLKVDVAMIAGAYAELYDWKTGKMKDDPDQLHLYALVAFILYPQVEVVRAGYIWLKDGVVSPPVTYRREQFADMLQYWVDKYEVLKRAVEVDDFPAKPSGLCHGWCPVKSCPHNKDYEG